MIEIRNVSKIYSNGNIGIEDLSLKLPSKGIIGLYGKSGSGKTTFLNCLGGIDNFTSGEIIYKDNPVQNLKDYVSYVFQEYKLIEGMSVFDNLRFIQVEEEKIDDLLRRFDLFHIKFDKVNRISGGQRQRVEIMRALLQDSDIILMDEPFSNLDEEAIKDILDYLKELKNNKLILLSSHNTKVLQDYVDQSITFEDHHLVSNTIELEETDKELYKITKYGKLSFKHAIWFSWQNIKRNKIKAFVSSLFLFISLVMLTAFFIILSLNEVDTCYEAFVKEDNSYMLLQNAKEKNRFAVEYYDWMERQYTGILDEQKEEMNSNIHLYYGNMLLLQLQEFPLEINSVWVLNDGRYQSYELKNNEILLSKDRVPKELETDLDALIGKQVKCGNILLKVKGIFTPYDGALYSFTMPVIRTNPDIMMNSSTFDQIKENPYVSQSVLMCDKENPFVGANVSVYNSILDDETAISFMSGTLPKKDGEVCVSRNWLRQNGYEETVGVGSTIKLNFYTKDEYGNGYIVQENSQIVGISRQKLIFTEEETRRILSSYSVDSLLQGNQAIIILNYNKENLRKAFSVGLIPYSPNIEMVGEAINFYQNFLIVFIGLALVFASIAILTILNNESESLIQNKKNIGVLICFKIKPLSLLKSYLIENIWIGIISFIGCLISYPFLFKFLEKLIYNHPLEPIPVTYFTPNYWSILLIFFFCILVLIISLLIPFKKLIRQRTVDILNERK